MDFSVIAILILAGVVVGVINTFAGAGATITITLYSLMGMDLPMCNATNRVSVIFQCSTMSLGFYRQGKLDVLLGLKLSIPTIIGAVIGTQLVGYVSNFAFALLLCTILLVMLMLIVFNPLRAIKGKEHVTKPNIWHYILLLFIGFYGGSFHIGVGYLFLMLFLVGLGYDLLSTNALKGFVVLMYTIFSIAIFAYQGEIDWAYGLVHSIGNVIGAYFATKYSQYIPLNVLRYALILFIPATIAYIVIFKIL